MPGYHGIRVTSARAGAAMTFGEDGGDNVVVYGADGQVIHDLRPVREISFACQPNGTLRETMAAL